MNGTATPESTVETDVIQLVTFRVGNVLLGIDISYVQEINRHLDVTRVPGADRSIMGVVNLRGDVVTILDPRRIFGLSETATAARCRNLVLRIGNERIGVMVDEVADILHVHGDDLVSRPSNVESVDSRFIDSVYLHDDDIVVILDPHR